MRFNKGKKKRIIKRYAYFSLVILYFCTLFADTVFAEQEEDFPWVIFYPAFIKKKPEIVIGFTGGDSPILAMATEKDGKEAIAVIGEKDSNGNITKLTGFLYLSPDGNFLEIELGADGLPVSLSDSAGTKASFSNYTDSSVEITFFDNDNNLLGGPAIVEIDQFKLSEYLQLYSSFASLSSSAATLSNQVRATSSTISNTQCASQLLRFTIILGVKGASLGFSITACAASIGASFVSPFFVPAAVLGCTSAYLQTVAILPLVGVTEEHEFYRIADTVATDFGIASCLTSDIVDCLTTFANYVAENKLKQCTETIPPDTPIFSFPQRPKTAWLGVGKPGTGSGTVTSSPVGVNCAAAGTGNCSKIYDIGTNVTLTAVPDPESIFDGWAAGPGNHSGCTGTGGCVLTMNEDVAVTATFSLVQGTWSGAYEYVTPSGDGGCSYDSGGTFSVTINVSGNSISGTAFMDGFQLRWTNDCSLYGYASSNGSVTGTISGNTASGSFSFPIAETGGTWSPSFNATLSGNTFSGTLTAGGSGTFTMTKQ
jgi:hypothetical protein